MVVSKTVKDEKREKQRKTQRFIDKINYGIYSVIILSLIIGSFYFVGNALDFKKELGILPGWKFIPLIFWVGVGLEFFMDKYKTRIFGKILVALLLVNLSGVLIKYSAGILWLKEILKSSKIINYIMRTSEVFVVLGALIVIFYFLFCIVKDLKRKGFIKAWESKLN